MTSAGCLLPFCNGTLSLEDFKVLGISSLSLTANCLGCTWRVVVEQDSEQGFLGAFSDMQLMLGKMDKVTMLVWSGALHSKLSHSQD